MISRLDIIKRVASRALQAGMGRDKCFYCHAPLRVKGGVCRNCGAPATPIDDPPPPAEERKVRDEIKHKVRKDSPANFMKG
jgi:predicted amidophosphoribosyltransferase